MSESHVESKVCEYARIKGFMAYKFKSPQRKNVPDRLFLCPGAYTFFIEFKAFGEKPSAGQLREIRRLVKLGYTVHVVDNILAGKHIIDEIHTTHLSKIGYIIH